MSSKSDDVIDQFLGTTSSFDRDFDRAVSTYARAGSKVWDDLMNREPVERREPEREREPERHESWASLMQAVERRQERFIERE